MSESTIQLAQAVPDPSGGGGFGLFLPLIAFFILMWALIIRPQQKQQKQQKQMISQVAKGDQVVTTGGIHGKVTGVTDDILTVEIAERVRIKVNRSAVATRVASSEESKA